MGCTPGTTPEYLSLLRTHQTQKPSVSQGLYQSYYSPYWLWWLAPTPALVFCRVWTPNVSYLKHKSTTWQHQPIWTRCLHLMKRIGCCAWPHCSFSWSDCACDHPSSHWPVSLVVFVFAMRMIMVLIVLMTIAMLLIIAILSAASMIVAIYAMLLPVAWIMAVSNGKMSHLLFFWLFSPWASKGHWLLYWQPYTSQNRGYTKAGPWAPSCLSPRTCTDVPWAVERRFVCSPLVLWATPLFKRWSHHWGSWGAVLGAMCSHASAWRQTSWWYKANKLAGCQHSETLQLPWGNP